MNKVAGGTVRYPEKVGPGKYDVKAWANGTLFTMRFKTERDAYRFYRAAQYGIQIEESLDADKS